MVIQPGPSLMSFTPGDYGFLHCQVSGMPKPRVSWEKDGAMVTSNGRVNVFGNGTLTISDVGPQDVGKYQCLADNGLDETQRRQIQVLIKGE